MRVSVLIATLILNGASCTENKLNRSPDSPGQSQEGRGPNGEYYLGSCLHS